MLELRDLIHTQRHGCSWPAKVPVSVLTRLCKRLTGEKPTKLLVKSIGLADRWSMTDLWSVFDYRYIPVNAG